jgi:hypothetical protein
MGTFRAKLSKIIQQAEAIIAIDGRLDKNNVWYAHG